MKTTVKKFENMSMGDATLYFETCVELMDNKIRNQLHSEISYDDDYDDDDTYRTKYWFLHRYSTLHFEKFGKDFIVD